MKIVKNRESGLLSKVEDPIAHHLVRTQPDKYRYSTKGAYKSLFKRIQRVGRNMVRLKRQGCDVRKDNAMLNKWGVMSRGPKQTQYMSVHPKTLALQLRIIAFPR